MASPACTQRAGEQPESVWPERTSSLARAHSCSDSHFRSLVLQRCVAAVLQVEEETAVKEEEKAATKGSKKSKKKK